MAESPCSLWLSNVREHKVKATYKKGLLRLAVVGVGVLIGLPFAKRFSFLVVCALLAIGWVVYWLIGGFFGID